MDGIGGSYVIWWINLRDFEINWINLSVVDVQILFILFDIQCFVFIVVRQIVLYVNYGYGVVLYYYVILQLYCNIYVFWLKFEN